MRTLIVIGGMLLLLAALVQMLTVRQTLKERAQERSYGRANVVTLRHAVMNQMEGNRVRIKVWADTAEYAESRRRAHLVNVRFTAYPDPGRDTPQEPVEGVAAEAEVQDGKKTLELIGQVHIQQGSRTEFKGERLIYDYGQGLITSEEPVWIRHGRTIHEGATLRYSVPEERAELTRPYVWE